MPRRNFLKSLVIAIFCAVTGKAAAAPVAPTELDLFSLDPAGVSDWSQIKAGRWYCSIESASGEPPVLSVWQATSDAFQNQDGVWCCCIKREDRLAAGGMVRWPVEPSEG